MCASVYCVCLCILRHIRWNVCLCVCICVWTCISMSMCVGGGMTPVCGCTKAKTMPPSNFQKQQSKSFSQYTYSKLTWTVTLSCLEVYISSYRSRTLLSASAEEGLPPLTKDIDTVNWPSISPPTRQRRLCAVVWLSVWGDIHSLVTKALADARCAS